VIVRELAARLGLDVDGAAFQAGDAALSLLRGGLVAIGTLAAAAATGLAAAAAKTAAYADETYKASQRTGIAVDELQALQYAAERADVGVGMLQAALRHMANKGVKDFSAELRTVADQMQKMPDGGAKAKYAIEKLGRAGMMMIPMLNKGSAGLDEMMQKARDMGLVLGPETQQRGEELKDAIEDVQGYLRGLTYAIGGPALKPIRAFLERMSAWIKANRELIAQRAEQAVEAFSGALSVALKLLEPVADIVFRIVEFLADKQGALVVAGVALGAIFAPALTGAIALLAIIEEVWGWMTGKRNTVLEDAFGPFAEVRESTFLKFLEAQLAAIKWLIEKINAGILYMKENLEIDSMDQLNSKNVKTSWREYYGTKGLLHLLGGPLGGLWLGNKWEENKRAAVARDRAASAALPSEVPVWARPPSSSVSFGDIIVQSQASDPVQVAKEVRREVGLELQAAFAGAKGN
jgi:hypothetical protein